MLLEKAQNEILDCPIVPIRLSGISYINTNVLRLYCKIFEIDLENFGWVIKNKKKKINCVVEGL